MNTFTVPAEGRDPKKPKLRVAEATEMAAIGFRFSIFHPEEEEFRLSLPYTLAIDQAHQTLTFMQA